MADSSGDSTALIGVDKLKPPAWAEVDQQVAASGAWQTVRALPAAIALVARLAWSTSPLRTVLAATAQLASGCSTAFGLFATANVLSALLAEGPTPGRVVDSLPAIAAVSALFLLSTVLDHAVTATQSALVPLVRAAAQDELNVAVAGVPLLVWEDADFQELARQGGARGITSLEASVRLVGTVTASLVRLAAAIVTTSLLSIWLLPALLASTAAEAWASMRAAKIGYTSFLNMIQRRLQLYVAENLLVARDVATERHALGLQEPLLAEHRRITADVTARSIRAEHRKSAVQLLGDLLSGAGLGLAFVILGLLLYAGLMPLALAGTAVVAIRTASSALSTTMVSINQLYEHSFYLRFYQQFLHESRARQGDPGTVDAPSDPVTIRFKSVSFTYPGAEKPALRDIDLSIHRGQIIALVGRNGSGKTTLGKLLTGLYPPTTGTVIWDDVDLSTARPHTVHDRVALISQDPAQWPMTAENNIRISQLDIRGDATGNWASALRESGAKDVINTLPQREETVLSRQFQHGVDLSGGQWQRFGIARGIYRRDASVLVADEPTAALDAEAETRVFAGLQHATRSAHDDRHRTTIIVTHRLANIRHADRILVLDDGRIIENGTHEQLLATRGLYRELYNLQASAYEDAESTLG